MGKRFLHGTGTRADWGRTFRKVGSDWLNTDLTSKPKRKRRTTRRRRR